MLDELVSRIEAAVETFTHDYEIILVNDCSPDDSWNKMKEIGAQNKKVKGVNLSQEKDLLPGYVFIFHDERIVDYGMFAGIDGVIRRVGRTETGYELEGPDREFALGLLEKDGKVGAMRMVKVGEKIRMEDPLFAGSEGVVTKIDYRKERARVDFKFEGNDCHAWVAVEDVRKVEE